VVESDYLNIDTNTVDGLAKWNELKKLYNADDEQSLLEYAAKFEPKVITYTDRGICRKLKFYPKRNPQPMCAYGESDWPKLPMEESVVKTNGHSLTVYPAVDFDLEKAEASVSKGESFGANVDFRFERYYVETNGVEHFYGRMVFAPGCGACRLKKTGDDSFPTCYVAVTNATFEPQVDFYVLVSSATDKTLAFRRLIDDDEYLVLRTRMKTSDGGSCTNGWHYSKLIGPARIKGRLYIKESVFNPRFNDPNLELDLERNLTPGPWGRRCDVRWP